ESGYSIMVGGTTFNEANPDGVITLSGSASNGCDSVVTVDLTFESCVCPAVFHTETYSGCSGDGYSVQVNGTVYNESNPAGMETFMGGSFNGCDSVVTVSLSFAPPPSNGNFEYQGCMGDGFSIEIGGVIYDETNTSGTAVPAGIGFNGCDSTVSVNLTFFPGASGSHAYSGCEGDGYSIQVNGVIYNESNDSGTELIDGGAANGCDSTVTIALNYAPASAGVLTYSGCAGDNFSVLVNGTTYNEGNPIGIETFDFGAANGCDSTVAVNLDFNALPEVLLSNLNGSLTASSASSGSYQWYKDNVLINGRSGTTYTATENGAYRAVLTDGDGCVGTSITKNVLLIAVLDVVLDASISIYPNPVQDKLQLTFHNGNYNDLELSIVDLSGRTLDQVHIISSNMEIDMRAYNSGVYLFTFETKDGRKAVRKVVKQY
ncbi:MAG: T9SS type A sorting domain-containing protein, partial [Bacteroidetes bacterium]|nr:T9SS type A sorting domain-containing protein [Bacteroidota bacterium]